ASPDAAGKPAPGTAGPDAGKRTAGSRVGHMLSWVPFVIVFAGIVLVLFNIGFNVGWATGQSLFGSRPQAVATTAALTPGDPGWMSAPSSEDNGAKFPGVIPAQLNVEIVSLDIAAHTISARLSLFLNHSVVSHLRLNHQTSHPGLVSLKAVPRHM